jgi:hypothetical protein
MKQWGRRTSGLTMVASLALALGYCGGGSPAGPVTPTAPPVTTPTPTPAPTPDPPISASCAKLPVGTANAPCRAESPEYVDVVYNAIRTLQSEQSFIFDGDEVKSVGAYYVELIKVLDRQGLCAETDGEELGVTDSAGSNEQYDVLTANNRVRFGPPSYRVTCRPSAIPFAPRGLGPQIAGCPLAPSHEIACGREPSGQYYGDVEAAIDQLMKEKPEIFNFDDTAAGTNWPLVKDHDGYNNGLIAILTQKGYCARFDGEEIALKRGSNKSSEQYDVNFQDKYIRRGSGIYRSSCYPAAF